jgi:hypothetical protein
MQEMSAALDLVADFHQAVNAADSARLLALVTPDVEVGGPRGGGSGAALVADWVARAGITLIPGRVFARRDVLDVLVVEQDASWKDAATGAAGPAQPLATVLRLRRGRIAAILRYPSLAEALAAAGLGESDLVPPGTP